MLSTFLMKTNDMLQNVLQVILFLVVFGTSVALNKCNALDLLWNQNVISEPLCTITCYDQMPYTASPLQCKIALENQKY